MRRILIAILIPLSIAVAGVALFSLQAPDAGAAEIPTVAVLPSLTPDVVLSSSESSISPSLASSGVAQMPTASETTVPSITPSATLAPTSSPTATVTEMPTQTPISNLLHVVQPNTVLPTSEPLALEVPDEPISGQIVVQFQSGTSAEEREAYVRSIGGEVEQTIDALNAVVVRVPEGMTQDALPESPVVTAAEPDYVVTALIDFPINDPMYGDQWAIPVIGVAEAWSLLADDAPKVTVAVIDSGICANHPDLEGRILAGYDFVEQDSTPQDGYGHGCSVSGVIAANTSNSTGIAGIAPNAQIMPLRVLDAQGYGSYSNVAAAITYAADHGAQIINLSLGGAMASPIMESAVNYAVAKGVIVIAAAGNTGQQGVFYPAAYAPVYAVASVDSNLTLSSFSSYGPEIDFLAPGRNILTTKRDGTYGAVSGTSVAAPQVAGIAALEMALLGEAALSADANMLIRVVVALPTPVPTNELRPTEEVTPDSSALSASPDIQDAEVAFDFRQPQGLSADDASMTSDGLLIPGSSLEGSIVSDAIAVPLDAPEPFLAVGSLWVMPSLAEDLHIAVRGSRDGDTWGDWQEFDELIYTGTGDEVSSDLEWFDPSIRFIQYRIEWQREAPVEDTLIQQVRFAFISPGVTPPEALAALETGENVEPDAFAQAYPKPPVTSRTGWGCPTGQTAPGWTPEYTTVTHLIVHHTAGANTDPATTDWPAVVRAIWNFHTNTRGWGDIGYNYLIDPNGVIYEGRAGGDNVIGAHFSCVNGGTMGVSLMGYFMDVAPTSAAQRSLERLLAWKADQRGLSPTGSSYHNSSRISNLMTISGHRDSASSPVACGGTSCPGTVLYSLLPTIRNNVSSLIASSSDGPGAPTILAPANGEVISNTQNYQIRLQAGALSGRPGEVTDYYVKIDDDPNFGSVNFSAGWTTNSTITINTSLPDGVYYIRVWQGDGQQGSPAVNSVFIVSSTPLANVYQTDFETAIGSEWSSTGVSYTPSGSRRFLGEFGNSTVTLNLNNLPTHSRVYVTFDAYIIRSWDGNSGPDVFNIAVSGGSTLLNTTFSNESTSQAFPGSYPGATRDPQMGAAEINKLGYSFNGTPRDSVYRLGFVFNHTSASLGLNFSASGLSGLADESWGLDNVRVYIDNDLTNDRIGTAQVITALPYSNTQANIQQATVNGVEPTTCAGKLNNTVWYRYRSNSSQMLTLRTDGSNYDTVLAVYTGTPSNLTPVACNDDTSTAVKTSSVTFAAAPLTTYYILVGKYGMPLTTPATLVLNVTSGPLFVSPVQQLPDHNATTSTPNPTFRWYIVSGADRYELALGRSSLPTNIVYTGRARTYTPPAALLPTTYYWRVRSVAADGSVSDWSTVRRITITAAADAVPLLNMSESAAVTLTWNRITWAQAYQVEVSVSPAFDGAADFTLNTPSGQLSVTTGNLANGRYYWRVRARDANGTWRNWGETASFTVDVP